MPTVLEHFAIGDDRGGQRIIATFGRREGQTADYGTGLPSDCEQGMASWQLALRVDAKRYENHHAAHG